MREEWEKRAKLRYKDIMHHQRKFYEENNEYKPTWASAEAWERWVLAWKSKEYEASRSRGRRNRRRGDEVTHTSGSVSARRTLRILV